MLLKQILVTAFCITVLVSMMVIVFARQLLIHPLRKAVDIINDIAQGNFHVHLEMKATHKTNTKDEICVLVKALKSMARKLKLWGCEYDEATKKIRLPI